MKQAPLDHKTLRNKSKHFDSLGKEALGHEELLFRSD